MAYVFDRFNIRWPMSSDKDSGVLIGITIGAIWLAVLLRRTTTMTATAIGAYSIGISSGLVGALGVLSGGDNWLIVGGLTVSAFALVGVFH